MHRIKASREAKQSILCTDAPTLWDGSRLITLPDAELDPTFILDMTMRDPRVHYSLFGRHQFFRK